MRAAMSSVEDLRISSSSSMSPSAQMSFGISVAPAGVAMSLFFGSGNSTRVLDAFKGRKRTRDSSIYLFYEYLNVTLIVSHIILTFTYNISLLDDDLPFWPLPPRVTYLCFGNKLVVTPLGCPSIRRMVYLTAAGCSPLDISTPNPRMLSRKQPSQVTIWNEIWTPSIHIYDIFYLNDCSVIQMLHIDE